MPAAHRVNAILTSLAITTPVLLGHPLTAGLIAIAIGAKTVTSWLWELYGADLVGDVARPIVVWLRKKLSLPSIERCRLDWSGAVGAHSRPRSQHARARRRGLQSRAWRRHRPGRAGHAIARRPATAPSEIHDPIKRGR